MDDEDEVTDQITNNLAVDFTEPGAILKKGIKFQNEKEFDEYMSTDSLITTLVTTSISNNSKVKQHFDEMKKEVMKWSICFWGLALGCFIFNFGQVACFTQPFSLLT